MNGIKHDNAHSAIQDALVTIEIAKILKHQTRLKKKLKKQMIRLTK